MKTSSLFPSWLNRWLTSVAIIVFSGVCNAQPTQTAQVAETDDYAVTEVGPHSQVWKNGAGQTVTQIQTGLNFWDGQQWSPSVNSFAISPDGNSFIANQIQDPTRIAGNINTRAAVSATTPTGLTLSSTPLAIALYDRASGLSAIVATITNSTGVLVSPQYVVFTNAFAGGVFNASVVYSLPDTGSFHQDVIFTGFTTNFDPTAFGFAAESVSNLEIEIMTEFYGEVPQPQFFERDLYIETNQAARARMASPDIVDYTIDFSDYVFGPGRAYTTSSNEGATVGAVVTKDFITTNGRNFLVESFNYMDVANFLHSLPPVVTKTSALNSLPQATKRRVAAADLPQLRVASALPAPGKAMAMAMPQGLSVDYIVTIDGTGPVVYTSDSTYFVSGTVYNSGPATMESCVFKFPSGTTGEIEIENTLTLATTNFRTAIFTSANDNTAGATLSTTIWTNYTGNPTNHYGSVGLDLNTTTNISLNNLRFCYMNTAVRIEAVTHGQTLSLWNLQMVDCAEAIFINGASGSNTNSATLTLTLNNCLMANIGTLIQAQGIAIISNGYNCTTDTTTNLLSMGTYVTGPFTFTNSIFSTVTSEGTLGSVTLGGAYNGFYSSPTFGSSQTSASSSPYVEVCAGNYYLPPTSGFLTGGTTNVPASLLAELEMKTTQAPQVLTNTFTANTVLSPVALRDTIGPALGWHYDPLDYIAAFSISNATLLLTNGVALAYYDNLGVWLQDDAQLVSQGTPNFRNYLVYYGQVQEQPVNLWGVSNAVAQSLPIAPLPYYATNRPFAYLRLTTISAPTGETNLWTSADSNQVISGLTLRDCEVYGSGANWQMSESNHSPVVGLTNNVFYRVPFAISNSATMMSFNNLFYGTTNTNAFTISIHHRAGSGSPNTNENNVFDGVIASLDGSVGYNAYLHGATNINYTNNNDIWTNLTWQGGPLGYFYQSITSPLLSNGSTYATNLGLYHYTVLTNETVEGLNIVSRGYHYVALGTNGLPLDTSGDGIPDYLADAYGNNSGGTGAWSNYVSPNGLSVPNGLVVFTPLK